MLTLYFGLGAMSVSTPNRYGSDPTSYTCTCPGLTEGGSVLLFYRYWANTPTLPPEHQSKAQDPQALADFHKNLASQGDIGGKFRIASEGFNITLGGTTSAIATYIERCCRHWSFSGIDLSTKSARDAYFKPTPGCTCVFGGKPSIRVTAEITPLGITNYAPSSWSNVISLSPAGFHNLCAKGNIPLIDVRNHYESQIGYFVTADGTVAVRPAVRRFSQWPGYVVRHVVGNDAFKKSTGIATYCTGGIRCEKGARWLQEALEKENTGADTQVYTLHGGIVAYQAWIEREVEAGRKQPEDSFFKGKNYVFDARGAIGTDIEVHQKVSKCHGCSAPEDRLGKCTGAGCHLVLVVCKSCDEQGGVCCCEDCRNPVDRQCDTQLKQRQMCQCESSREKLLWGDEGARLSQAGVPKKRKAKSKQNGLQKVANQAVEKEERPQKFISVAEGEITSE